MAGISRRGLLGVTGGLAAAALVGCGRNSGGPSEPGSVTLQFAWWGNELRDQMTNDAIAAYLEQHEGLEINAQPAEFSAYWERLATQTAANDAPDVIQMADAFIGDYGTKGALLDLTDLVDTSKFGPGTLDSGLVDGKLVGINAGINSPVIMANPAVFDEAGVEIPDDKTWTWDDYREIAAELTSKTPDGTYGSASPFSDKTMQAWLRQHGGDLFTADGQLGFTGADLEPYFALMQSYIDAKSVPPAEMITEEEGKSLEQSSLAEGRTGFAIFWSNQLAAITQATGGEVAMLRLPCVTGKPEDRKAWYHPSMLWSASSRTEHPDQVGELISWWVNNVDAASICLDERGYPANTEVAAAIESKLTPEGQRSAQFIADIEPELGDTPPAPPPGGATILGDVLGRAHSDMLFGKINGKEAANRFFTEAKDVLA